MKPAYELLDKPKLLIVDGAGTLFDPGSVIPVYAFQGSFKNALMENGKPYGIEVSFSTVMEDVGIDKLEHLQLILKKQEVLEQFSKLYNRQPTDEDVKRIYSVFDEQLIASAPKTEEIEGVKEAVYRLRYSGIPLIMTTGYYRNMVDATRKKLTWLDDVLAVSFTSSDVKKGRPAPFMIYRALEEALIKNAAYAVNVGDTKADTVSADNAYMPGIIVTSGSLNNEEANKVNKAIDRKHLIVPSLVEVINFTLDGTLADRIRELNK